MKPQLVPVILGGRRGVRPFDPIDLFTSGVAGAWYDPSDYSTLFQDSAGTTPVTAVEQPVGLMLDKSQGLVLGSELVTTTSMVAQNANGTVTVVGSTLVATCTVNGLYGARFSPAPGVVIGSNYFVTVTISTNSASKAVLMDFGGYSSRTITSTTGSQTFRLSAVSGTTISIYVQSGVAGESFTISLISVRELPGNHASQATAASRPVLRARYNLLTYSEQFDNAAWTKNSVTIAANTLETTDPIGGNTADKATLSAGTANKDISIVGLSLTSTVTYSAYFKASTHNFIQILNTGDAQMYANFNFSTGTVGNFGTQTVASITDVGNGWYRITVRFTPGTFASTIRMRAVDSNTAVYGDTTSSTGIFYVWGADLRTGTSAGTYQRIAAATDYATAGFLPYLYFVTDDSFSTNSINFSATDKMSVCAGVTKLSDAAAQIVCELSATSSTGNNGSFAIISALSPSNYAFYLYGNALASRTATTYASPVTNVVSVKYDISQSTVPNEIAPQINGAVPTLADAGGAGTGNFGNYPLYIGRRNNASLPFEGRIYQLIVCGKILSASELASTEAYVATKTGVTL